MILLDDNLKMSNLTKKTEERIKSFTMEDLKTVLESIEESEAKIMVRAIRESKWSLCANMVEFVTYREMQKKVLISELKEQAT